jgi:ATP-binding cassette subfamily F protein 3
MSKNEQRRREREMEQLEEKIGRLETRIAEIEALLGDPAIYAPGADSALPKSLAEERARLDAELAQTYAAWEKIGEELAAV